VPLRSRVERVLEESRSISELSQYNDPALIESELSRFPEAISWLPMKGVERDMVVLLDDAGNVLGVVPLAPWD